MDPSPDDLSSDEPTPEERISRLESKVKQLTRDQGELIQALAFWIGALAPLAGQDRDMANKFDGLVKALNRLK